MPLRMEWNLLGSPCYHIHSSNKGSGRTSAPPDKEGGLVSSRDLAKVTWQAVAQATEQHHSAPIHTSHRTGPGLSMTP